MESRTKVSVGGVGINGLLGLVFIVLKLCNVIDWSWWWVTAPFWIPVAIVIIILVVSLIITSLNSHIKEKKRRQRHKYERNTRKW